MITPTFTRMNPKSVPMFTSLITSLNGTSAARMAISTPSTIVSPRGRRRRHPIEAVRSEGREVFGTEIEKRHHDEEGQHR
jgi:hypothetical protein